MSKESYRKEVQRRLLALQKHPAYQGNADAWGKAVAAFSARCALRAFPLLTQSGDLIFWTYKEQRQHFIAVEACLLGTSCWAINHIHLHNQLRAAATAAGADSKVAYSSSSAYAAVFAVSAAYFAAVAVDTAAFSVSSAYSEGAASNASNAADAAFDAAGAADATAAAAYAYAVATADLTQLEADNTDLFQLPLWPGGIPGRIQKILDGPWNQVLSSIDSQATATRYQGFLDGKPDWGACQKAFQEWAEEHAETDTDPLPAKNKPPVAAAIPDPPSEDTLRYDPEAMSAHSDQPTDIDHLGVESHAVALAGYLSAKSTQTPLTVSIEAPWGMGKSTFLKLVRKSLRSANTKPHVIWFNPWRHDAGEALWAAFLYEFADQVEKGTPFCAKQWARACFYGQAMKDRLIPKSLWFILIISIILASYFWLKPYLDQTQIALSWLFPTLLTTATVVAPELNKFFLGLKLDVAKVWKKDDEKARVCAAEKASGHFRAFLKANLHADERIYVIIDDLDRCAAPKAAELLDSLQLLISGNGDDMESFPVIFLLAMDREKVAAGVAVKFEKLLPYVGEGMPSEYKDKVHAGREFGYEYLQKFIDVPFRLPGAGPIGMERYITGLAGHQTSYPPFQKTTPAGTPPQQPSPEPATSQTKIPTSSFKRAITLPLTKSVERVQEATREQFKKLDLTAALTMAAPLLGNNPRRVKQYLNLLRLRVAIAEATDLFSQDVKITHLAKLVVVELARPVIYRRLCEEPKLRSDLEKAMSLDGTAFGIFAKEGEENPTLQELKKSLNQSDLEWFKAHLDSLNQSLEKTKTQDPFPTALLMDRIFHLTSPPGEIEARIVTEMK